MTPIDQSTSGGVWILGKHSQFCRFPMMLQLSKFETQTILSNLLFLWHFSLFFVEINPDFMACYEYLMGIVAVLPKIFIIFLAFRPFFRTFRWSPRPCGCEDARRWRHSLGIQSLYIYIYIYIPRSTKSWENAGWTGEPGAWRVIPRIVGKQASKPGFGGKTLIYHILEYPHIATQSHSHSGLIFLIFDAKEVQWIQRPESQP